MVMPLNHRRTPKGYRRGTFQLAHETEGLIECEAFLKGALAIHRDYNYPDEAWKVSHAASGYAAGGAFTSIRAALQYAEAIESVIDWSRIRRGKRVTTLKGMTGAMRERLSRAAYDFRASA